MSGPAYLKLLMKDIRKRSRTQMGSIVQVGLGSTVGTRSTDYMGPGYLENPILKHFCFGKKTNDWKRLVHPTCSGGMLGCLVVQG